VYAENLGSSGSGHAAIVDSGRSRCSSAASGEAATMRPVIDAIGGRP
jgi:hypothetical protein